MNTAVRMPKPLVPRTMNTAAICIFMSYFDSCQTVAQASWAVGADAFGANSESGIAVGWAEKEAIELWWSAFFFESESVVLQGFSGRTVHHGAQCCYKQC